MGSPYPRPEAPQSAEFLADKVIGIIIMVLAALITLCGIFMMLGIGLFGAALTQAAAEGGAGADEAAAIAGFAGVIAAFAGVITIASGILSFVIGFGIMKSAKWGFILGVVVYAINLLLNIVGFNLIGLVISGALLAYCALRLGGQVGPKPI